MVLCLLAKVLLLVTIFGIFINWVNAGCDEEITAPGTELTSPQYPKTYSGGLDCTQVIRFNKNHKITLTFLSFNLAYMVKRGHPPNTSDIIKIRDGEDENAPMIGKWLSGSSIPNPIQSSGNTLFIQFHSLNYNSVATNQKRIGYRIRADLTTVSCGGSQYSPSCSLCPKATDTEWCHGDCHYDHKENKCKEKMEFERVLNAYCDFTSRFLPPKTFDSLRDAKLACSSDKGCLAVYDKDCNTKSFSLCKTFIKDLRSTKKSYSCVHKKKESEECIDVQLSAVDDLVNWNIGSCSNTTYISNIDAGSEVNVDRCCIKKGDYILSCKSNNQHSWKQGYLEIQGRKYCNDFVGYRALRRIKILGFPLPYTTTGTAPNGSFMSSDKTLIPRPPLDGCTKNRIDCKCPGTMDLTSGCEQRHYMWQRCHETCLCEEHCAWDKCYLIKPSPKCLDGTQSSWLFDYQKGYWVAQKVQGNESIDGSRSAAINNTPKNVKSKTAVECRKNGGPKYLHTNTKTMDAKLLFFASLLSAFLFYFFHSPRKIIRNPLILLGRMRNIFSFLCFFLALYMTITQVDRYLQNNDASEISYRTFNQSPRDKYPTISICFKGHKLYWYHDIPLFSNFGITSTQYDLLFKGETGVRYQYDHPQNLYKKYYLSIRNVSDLGFKDHLYLDISNILVMSSFVYRDQRNSIHYDGKSTKRADLPFNKVYQTPDTICFTRKSEDKLRSIRLHDSMVWNRSVFENRYYSDAEIQIFFHYPGQFLRSFNFPTFKRKLYQFEDWNGNVDVRISDVSVLKHRPNSKIKCDAGIQNDDSKAMVKIIQRLKCVPPYWHTMVMRNWSYASCNTTLELKTAYNLSQNYDEILSSYDPPCIQMNVLAISSDKKLIHGEPIGITIYYGSMIYQMIDNLQEFGFESFWSAVGGFIGIFLGYSLLQLPELFNNLS